MASKQAIKAKLESLSYPDFEIKPGEDGIPMLYIESRLICSVYYALEMPDNKLHALIEETLQYGS